ncbi:unnamed protein product [Lactuca saligna]|uniref:Uncharacterized protein n=1 Tax=Lactuca saligna TaxID=75948 RepID=A0AA36EKS3_LACSI|nr:unnamed protein product [Lactuca saligna]
MASSEKLSFIDQSESMIILAIKPNENLIINSDASRYNSPIKPMIECLKFSPLMKALTMAEVVPLIHLCKSFSMVIHAKTREIVNFEVANNKTSINKANFHKLLVLVSSNDGIEPESIPTIGLIEMFYHMGYTINTSLLFKFRKSFLPAI